MRIRWRFGVIAGIVLSLFCLYPQFKMFYLRGGEWNGHYAYNDIDEAAYASYLRALIDGRPRKNDPYTGRDQTPETPQPESLFSIQFAAPYSIAIPSRIFGIGVPWAMTAAGALAGFLAALAAFWFFRRLSGDDWFAMAASLATFAFGALAAGEGAFPEIFFDGFSYPYFPGFRRYIPALAMPAFFLCVGFLWRYLVSLEITDSDAPRGNPQRMLFSIPLRTWISGAAATAGFAFCVYSYFYIWTTAAAFLACIFLFWVIERPLFFKRQFMGLLAIGGAWMAVLIPYAYLLTHRAASMDNVQLLVRSHMPDLTRVPEFVSLAALFVIVAALLLKACSIKETSTLFAVALALVPFAVFNQQVITGRSLQPIHYQVFIGNYAALLALFVAISLLWKRSLGQGRNGPKMICLAVFLVAVCWGVVECHYTVRVLDDANVDRDRSLPTANLLDELTESAPDPRQVTVLSYDWLFADDLPSVSRVNVLWARHQHVFAGSSWEESKRRYLEQLYFQNVDEKGLERLLKTDFVTMIALFGWGRHSDRLSVEAKPLTPEEIADEVERYRVFRAGFNRADASDPLLSYAVVPVSYDLDLSMLTKWYELTEVGRTEMHTVYKLRLK